MLTENDLIEYDKLYQRFTTTDKGFQFMERYENLNKLIRCNTDKIVAKED